jgi:phage tail sheath gpL-like
MVLMLQYDPAKTEIVPNTLYELQHYDDTGQVAGYNSQMYVTHRKVWLQTGGALRVIGIPIAAPSGTAVATGDILTFTGVATKSGTVPFYIHGERFSVPVVVGDTADDLGVKAIALINGSTDILVQNATNLAGVVSAESSYGGLTANEIRIEGPAEDDLGLPNGISLATGALANGAGDEDTVLQAAYDAMILNPEWKTDIITPSATAVALDLAVTNIGEPDDGTIHGTGLWADEDYRPPINWTGNIGNYATATAPAANRKEEVANSIVAAPDRAEMPFVIAAVTAARCAAYSNSNPAAAPRGLSCILGPAVTAANDWTRGANGDAAANNALIAGVATIRTDADGNSILGDIVSTYRPAKYAFPVFQFVNNMRKVWNMGKSLQDDKKAYDNGVFVESVSEAPDQPLARDESSYRARVVGIAQQWQSYGIAYNSAFTIANMIVTFNQGGNPDRVDRFIPVLLSGNARVQSDTLLVDRNLAIAGETGIVVNVG